jgi:hypothetical protein
VDYLCQLNVNTQAHLNQSVVQMKGGGPAGPPYRLLCASVVQIQ